MISSGFRATQRVRANVAIQEFWLLLRNGPLRTPVRANASPFHKTSHGMVQVLVETAKRLVLMLGGPRRRRKCERLSRSYTCGVSMENTWQWTTQSLIRVDASPSGNFLTRLSLSYLRSCRVASRSYLVPPRRRKSYNQALESGIRLGMGYPS